jgi:uncharacterized membrane protein YebE (DUF533 family)
MILKSTKFVTVIIFMAIAIGLLGVVAVNQYTEYKQNQAQEKLNKERWDRDAKNKAEYKAKSKEASDSFKDRWNFEKK